MENKAPLSPHIQIYSWHISSLVSISHRITGIINIIAITFICLLAPLLIFGESKFEFITNGNTFADDKSSSLEIDENLLKNLKKINASKDDLKSHETKLVQIEEKHKIKTMWRKYQ